MSITIQVGPRGTLTLPKAVRKALGLEKGGLAIVETAAEGVILKPAVSFPIEMYTAERVAEFDRADAALAKRLERRR